MGLWRASGFLSEDGLTYVVYAGPEFEFVQQNPLDELCLASPAVVGAKLLIRTASKLYCLTEGAQLDAGSEFSSRAAMVVLPLGLAQAQDLRRRSQAAGRRGQPARPRQVTAQAS